MANLVKNGNFDLPDIATAVDAGVAITNWTKSFANIGLLDLTISGLTRTGLPSNINQASFIFQASADIRNVNQDIVFPTAGNYELTFYTLDSSSTLNSNTFNVILGSTVLQSVSYPILGIWYKCVVPFTVSKTQLTQKLYLQTTQYNSYVSLQRFTGVSIYSKDYTLDLYLEWIPDEDDKKNNRLI